MSASQQQEVNEQEDDVVDESSENEESPVSSDFTPDTEDDALELMRKNNAKRKVSMSLR